MRYKTESETSEYVDNIKKKAHGQIKDQNTKKEESTNKTKNRNKITQNQQAITVRQQRKRSQHQNKHHPQVKEETMNGVMGNRRKAGTPSIRGVKQHLMEQKIKRQFAPEATTEEIEKKADGWIRNDTNKK